MQLSSLSFYAVLEFVEISHACFLIIPALIIRLSFTLSLQAQNLPFQEIFPTLDFFTYWTAS